MQSLIKLPSIVPKEHIALWKVIDENSDSTKNIFLTHGTFSTRKVCLGIATFLAEQGHTCWIMEWRGHGASSKTTKKFNFETIAKEDFKVAFIYLFEELKINSLSCVTHSGGGICLTIFLIENPQYISKVKSAVFFGCQAFGAASNFRNYSLIKIEKFLTYLLGFMPAKTVGLEHNETYYTMKQWINWNLSQRFLSDKGKDYIPEMPKITTKILSVAGAGDKMIAPKSGCEKFLNAFQNPKNKLLYCGKTTGYKENYNHSRILHSKNSRMEIWKIVVDWIQKNRK